MIYLQLYDVEQDTYVREDKYVGRKYGDSDAKEAIRRFLISGSDTPTFNTRRDVCLLCLT